MTIVSHWRVSWAGSIMVEGLTASTGHVLSRLLAGADVGPIDVPSADPLVLTLPRFAGIASVGVEDGETFVIAMNDDAGSYTLALAAAIALAEQVGTAVLDPDHNLGGEKKWSPADLVATLGLTEQLPPDRALEQFATAADLRGLEADGVTAADLVETDFTKRPPQPAPLGRRIAAALVDVLVLSVVFGFLWGVGLDEAYLTPLAFLVGLPIIGLLNGLRVGSPGKRLFGLRLVDVRTGKRLGPWRSLKRTRMIYGLSVLIVPGVIDLVMPLIDKRHRSLHDRFSRSMVVDARKSD